MKASKALRIFERGFEENLTANETKEYITVMRNGLYLMMWYEQKYGKDAKKAVKGMIEEAKEIAEKH